MPQNHFHSDEERLIHFRQSLGELLPYRADALMNLIDAQQHISTIGCGIISKSDFPLLILKHLRRYRQFLQKRILRFCW